MIPGVTAKKSATEFQRESTRLARRAVELQHTGLALMKRARQLHRQSDLALQRAKRAREAISVDIRPILNSHDFGSA